MRVKPLPRIVPFGCCGLVARQARLLRARRAAVARRERKGASTGGGAAAAVSGAAFGAAAFGAGGPGAPAGPTSGSGAEPGADLGTGEDVAAALAVEACGLTAQGRWPPRVRVFGSEATDGELLRFCADDEATRYSHAWHLR